MSKQINNNNNNGIGFLGLLTVVFITLKLTNFITWSWWLVLAPLWGTFALAIFFIACFSLIIALVEGYLIIKRKGKKNV